jgi:hypothetical protein
MELEIENKVVDAAIETFGKNEQVNKSALDGVHYFQAVELTVPHQHPDYLPAKIPDA